MNVNHHRRAVFCHVSWNLRQTRGGRVVRWQPLTTLSFLHTMYICFTEGEWRTETEWLERRMPGKGPPTKSAHAPSFRSQHHIT